jgi:peroxiredoxin Q/BCP
MRSPRWSSDWSDVFPRYGDLTMRFRNAVGALTGAGLVLGFGGLATASAQQAPPIELKVGDMAPVFEGLADNGQTWNSQEGRAGKLLVVYFYPAAMTGGCTAQACMFRDDRTKLLDMGAEVVGVSGDRIANLKAFKGSNRLNFPLLSDTAGVIAQAFGVPTSAGGTIKREVDGQEIELTRDVTAARWTFIIGRDGRIVFKETEVDPAGDSKAVLAAIERLSSR